MQKTGWTIHSFFLVLSGLEKSFTLDMITRGQSTTIFLSTRSYAALRAADLDWIVGPGYSFGGYMLEKNHEKPRKTMKNHEKPWKSMKKQPGTMKNH